MAISSSDQEVVVHAEELPALTAKVVDALRGEALSCAMEIGLAKLMEANGLDLLVQKVKERLFPQRTAEARELLKQGMVIWSSPKKITQRQKWKFIVRLMCRHHLHCHRQRHLLLMGVQTHLSERKSSIGHKRFINRLDIVTIAPW